MVKSQIHAGGRGKGTFTNGFKGGVKFSATKEKAVEHAQATSVRVELAVDANPQRIFGRCTGVQA